MIKSCKQAYLQYMQHLYKVKNHLESDKWEEKRKIIANEINDVKDIKLKITSSIAFLKEEIEELSYQGE